MAPNEREVRIEVGYRLEPVLTDAKAGRIIREKITSAFKEGDFDKGIVDGMAAIKEVVKGEEEPTLRVKTKETPFWILFVFLILLLVYIAGFLARTKDFWAGGIIGAVLGVVAGAVLGSLLLLVLAVVGLGLWGLFLDYVLSKNYKKRKRLGLPTSWRSSWGGFSSGGGGFGGFGGGASGGGGTSRSW